MRNLTPHPHHMVPTLHHARAAALPGATTWPARARDTAERRSFTATPSSRAAGHGARPQLHLQRQSLRPWRRFACAGATARGAVVGEAGPRCPSPPPIARSTSVACRTTPSCRAHAGRGIWAPRIRGPGTTARSKCVRPVAAHRAPRKTRTLEGACSAVARLQACEPVCGYPSSSTWSPLLASRTPLCAQDVDTCRRWEAEAEEGKM